MKDREGKILEAIEAAERIRGQAFEADKSLEAIEGARHQLSVAQDELRAWAAAPMRVMMRMLATT